VIDLAVTYFLFCKQRCTWIELFCLVFFLLLNVCQQGCTFYFSVQEDFSVSFRFCHSLSLGNTRCCREFVRKGKPWKDDVCASLVCSCRHNPLCTDIRASPLVLSMSLWIYKVKGLSLAVFFFGNPTNKIVTGIAYMLELLLISNHLDQSL
jgi:hypothetical protein